MIDTLPWVVRLSFRFLVRRRVVNTKRRSPLPHQKGAGIVIALATHRAPTRGNRPDAMERRRRAHLDDFIDGHDPDGVHFTFTPRNPDPGHDDVGTINTAHRRPTRHPLARATTPDLYERGQATSRCGRLRAASRWGMIDDRDYIGCGDTARGFRSGGLAVPRWSSGLRPHRLPEGSRWR